MDEDPPPTLLDLSDLGQSVRVSQSKANRVGVSPVMVMLGSWWSPLVQPMQSMVHTQFSPVRWMAVEVCDQDPSRACPVGPVPTPPAPPADSIMAAVMEKQQTVE